MPRPNRESATSPRANEADRYAQLRNGKPSDAPTFTACTEGSIAAALDSVLREGDAIMFSRTSDGGALCVCVLTATDRLKRYAAHQAELDALLTALELL